MASTLDEIERAVSQLPQDQLRQFREWYEQFDSDRWDEQLESDAARGKLDTLAEEALRDHKLGKSTTL